MSYTYAVLGVSPTAYEEIRQRFLDAGYEHAIHKGTGNDPVEVLDMHGIALASETTSRAITIHPDTAARTPVPTGSDMTWVAVPAPTCSGQLHGFAAGAHTCSCGARILLSVEAAAVPQCMDISHQYEVTRIAQALGLPSARKARMPGASRKERRAIDADSSAPK